MNPQQIKEINNLLKSIPFNRNYQVKVGETFKINLPSIPLTGVTEFLRLEQEIEGDQDSIINEAISPETEGYLSPRQIIARAIGPGKVNIVIKPINFLSGEAIPGVNSLKIEVNVQSG